jgi:hypothetical protein
MPLKNASFEKKLYKHLKQIIENDFMNLLYAINGTSDHIHILTIQNSNYSLTDNAKNVKPGRLNNPERDFMKLAHQFIDGNI